jgi:hypothetical protein
MFVGKNPIPYIVHTHAILLFDKIQMCDSQIVFEDGCFYIVRKSIRNKTIHLMLTFAKTRDVRVADGFLRGYIYNGNNEIQIREIYFVQSLVYDDEFYENVCVANLFP